MTEVRDHFAEEIAFVANLRSERLIAAFSTVRREDFLGPGPWQFVTFDPLGRPAYRTTKDANPHRLYHNVAVAIDPARMLNNGQPGGNAMWIDALDLGEGERVAHVGSGAGYYTAIIAETVGATGTVTAFEIDPDLAGRARANLRPWSNVNVVAGSGTELGGTFDAIYINAGATHIVPSWLDSLAPGGRLVLPLTYALPSTTIGSGIVVAVKKNVSDTSARFVGPVAIYACTGARDEAMNKAIAKLLLSGSFRDIARVRSDAHEVEASCRLHGEQICIAA